MGMDVIAPYDATDLSLETTAPSAAASRSHAVVHMGPHKTSSSTIQRLSAIYAGQLWEDGYEMPWMANEHRWGDGNKFLKIVENHVEFSTCFLRPFVKEREIFPCVPELLLSGLEIAQQKNNIVKRSTILILRV